MTNDRIRRMLLAAGVLATSLPLLQVGCGGKSSKPAAPAALADTTPPTLTISGMSASPITAPVTMTFTFSEDVGSSFTLGDIAVTNGTPASTLIKVNPTHYTLIVSPPADTTGSMEITIAAGSFNDLAGNTNLTSSQVAQAFNTVVGPVSYAALDFNTPGLTYKMTDFGGTVSTFPAVGAPTGGPSTPVVQIVKTGGAEFWAGTTLSVGYLDSIGTIPFSALHTKLTAVVYSPVTGASFKLKVEDANDGGHAVETDAVATTGWQTLTFDMATPSGGTPALNPAYTYNKLSLFPNFGNVPGADQVYYVGPISFLGTSMPSAPPLVSPILTAPITAPAAPSLPAGSVISLLSKNYPNVSLDTWRTDWSSGTLTELTIDGDAMKKYEGLGFVGINFEGAKAIDASAMTYLHMDVWTPDTDTFKVKLVDFGAAGAWGNGDDTEFELTFNAASTPALTGTSQWVSLDIPLSAFTGMNRAHLAQMILSAPTGTGTVFVDNIYFHKDTAPTTAPAAPSLPAGSVISLLSKNYPNVSLDTWRTDWSSGTLTELNIDGDAMKKYEGLGFVGINFEGAKAIDASAMTYLHLDVWTPDIETFRVKLVDFGAAGAWGNGDDTEFELSFNATSTPALTGTSQWVSLDIPLSSFSGMNRSHLAQMILSIPTGTGTVFLDNVYFH
ncbi:MAG: Ig-like domain-containing protein [Holophagaceae bacterium]